MSEMTEMKTQGMDVESIETEVNVVEAEQFAEAIIEDETEQVKEKPYTFRKLGAPDVFLMFKIIGKIGLNEFMAVLGNGGIVDVVKNMTAEEKNADSGAMVAVAAVALDIAHVILGNIGKCEKEIYQLLSQTSNLSVEEITAEGNAVMFLEMVIDFVQKDEFPDFIKVVSSLFNK